MGTCTGVASSCALGGFALETRCHNGQVILYDTVQKLGWSVNIRNHGIKLILDRLFTEGADWKDEYNGEVDDESGESGLLSVFDWGWGRKKREDPDEPEKKPMREVPLPRPANEVEGTEGACSVSFSCWVVALTLTMSYSRTASIGSLETSGIVALQQVIAVIKWHVPGTVLTSLIFCSGLLEKGSISLTV